MAAMDAVIGTKQCMAPTGRDRPIQWVQIPEPRMPVMSQLLPLWTPVLTIRSGSFASN